MAPFVARMVRYLPPTLLLALAVVAWQVAGGIWNLPDYILPRPTAIWAALVDERDLLSAGALSTLQTAVLGFLLALVSGLALAILIHYSRLLERAVYPLVVASQTVPIVALAPVLVVLFGFSLLPRLIVVALVCFFPITVNAVDGFRSVDPDLVRLMRTFGAGRWRLFRDVEWPTALPYLFSGAKVAVTYSVIGALYGELAGSSEGLGYLTTQKLAQFDTAGLFAAVVLLSVMGIGLFVAVALAERLLVPWQRELRRRDALVKRR